MLLLNTRTAHPRLLGCQLNKGMTHLRTQGGHGEAKEVLEGRPSPPLLAAAATEMSHYPVSSLHAFNSQTFTPRRGVWEQTSVSHLAASRDHNSADEALTDLKGPLAALVFSKLNSTSTASGR